MEIILSSMKKNETADPIMTPPSGITVHVADKLRCVVLEGGMASGEPSVAILGVDPNGVGVVVQTSLDKFVMAAIGLKAFAERDFGWVQPEGQVSIIPGGPIDEVLVHEIPEGCYDRNCQQGHIHAVFTRSKS